MDEFYVICHNDEPLRFGSYCIATKVSSPFYATIYQTLDRARIKLKRGYYIGGRLVGARMLRVKLVHAEVKFIGDACR